MMQQAGGGQASEVRHPSSPRGAPATGNSGNIPNFSLLGQQLYGVNPMMAPGQNFNQSHQFMNQQMMQVPNSGGVAQASQAVQSGLGMQPSQAGLSAESIMNALASIQQVVLQLQAMVPYWAQQNQQFPNVAFQQQAAAAISQIAQVAANMAQQQPQSQQQQQQPQSQQQQNMSQQQQQNMSQQQQQQNMSQQQQQQNMSQQQQQQNMSQQQQQHNMACVPQAPISDSQQQQQLSQLFGASVTPAFNFFQQNGSTPGNNNTGGNVGLASNFPALQGGSTGVSVEMGTTATSLANQMAAIDGGVSGNSTSGAGQGLGVPPKSTVPNGGQTFVGGQVGANHGPSVANNISSLVRSKNGSPRSNNQIGSAMNRGGTVPGMARDMSHMNNNRSVNSGGMTASPVDDHDVGGARDDDDDGDGENLVPGSYDLVEMEAIEILAEHTHFCEICGKGFKRDANLRMHMRGHGDEYKTPAALARPDKASNEMTVVRQKRFSCPYVGCKRNKKHRKFQPLKTMLCVKNHYRRSHCPKILTCQKCKTKKFSVVADLKTHEKHCGCDKWQCSCGTTFSRKDKLHGHIGLFAGHTPAMNFNDVDGSGALDVSDVNGGPGNPSSMSSPGNDAAGFGLSGGGNLNSGNASSMSLGGGSGMGLGGNGLQGMTSRGGNPGGGSLNMSKDGNAMAPENSSSSDSFPSTGLITAPAMLQSLFTNKFYQTTSGGNSSSDGLH